MAKRPDSTISKPKIEYREARPYVAIAVRSPIRGMTTAAKKAMDKVGRWLKKHNIAPVGAPFWRYTVINMEGDMHLEVGFPVAKPVEGDETVIVGTLPAGNYATTVHTGRYTGKALYWATGDLLNWGERNNIEWDRHDVPEGDAWASRLEWYEIGPDNETDPDKFETVLTFKTK